MTSKIKEHTQWLEKLDNNNPTKYQYQYHCHNLAYLQHERLIHLIVMLLVSLLFALFFLSALLLQSIGLYLITGIFFILDLFYIKHYYLLENTVQSWYDIANKLEKHIYL